jgi:hypothetical protein
MGISFVYIGRDKATLKDKLPVEKLGDQLPLELGGGSAFGYAAPVNTSKTGISAIPGMLGLDTSTITELEEPLAPMKMPGSGFFGGGGNSTSFLGQLLSPSNPTTQKMLQKMLPSLLPSLPKDFKLSDIFPPGGIVTSNMDVLFDAVKKDHPTWLSGIPQVLLKEPKDEGAGHADGGHGHKAMIRAMYGLDGF